jgi:hypothetical protein
MGFQKKRHSKKRGLFPVSLELTRRRKTTKREEESERGSKLMSLAAAGVKDMFD